MTITMTETEAQLLYDLVGKIGHDVIYFMFAIQGHDNFQKVLDFREKVTTPLYDTLSEALDLDKCKTRRWSEMMKDVYK